MEVLTFQQAVPAVGRPDIARLLRRGVVQTILLLITLAPPISVGARLERFAFPIRANQSIPSSSIVRTGDRLCWTWVSDKVRLATSDNIDVFLDSADGDRSYPEVFDRVTSMPWHRHGSVPVGHYERGYCVVLPPFIKSGDPIRLQQIIHYRGLLNLWTVLVPLPEISIP